MRWGAYGSVVDTIVRPPATASPPAPPPRRRVRRLVTATIAVTLAAIVFSALYLWRYQPLSANGTGTYWADPEFATSVGYFTSPQGDGFSAYRVRYEDGSLFRYALTLYNDGPLPVTITNVGQDPDCFSCVFPLVFERASVAPASGQYQYDRRHATPFDRFVLQPGANRYVVIEARFDHCESYEPPGGVTHLSIPVGYRAWGLEHQVQLPMPYALEVRFRGGECPGGSLAGD